MIVCWLSLFTIHVFYVEKKEKLFIPRWLLTVILTTDYTHDLYQPTLVQKYTRYTMEIQFSVLLAHGVGRKTMQKSYPSTTLSVRALRALRCLNCPTSFTCGIHPHQLPISLGTYLSPVLGLYYLLDLCCWSEGLQLSYRCAVLSHESCWSKPGLQGWFPSCLAGQPWDLTCGLTSSIDLEPFSLPWTCLMTWTLCWVWPESLGFPCGGMGLAGETVGISWAFCHAGCLAVLSYCR